MSLIQAAGDGWEDKTNVATLYMQVPHTRLTTVLLQRASYARRSGMCPRCDAYLTGRNNIIDRGIIGLWCAECDDKGG